MRLGLLLVVVPVAASLGLAAACSSFSGDPSVAGAEAGSEAATSADAATVEAAADAGLRPTPGSVECFGAVCNDGTDCCFDTDAGTTACASGNKRCGGAGIVALHCDEKSDCAPSQICCVGFFGNADCVDTCNGERLCHTDSECEVGSSCVEVPCRGGTIGACGPVGPYVKSFCK
jgi:hypothetical protein